VSHDIVISVGYRDTDISRILRLKAFFDIEFTIHVCSVSYPGSDINLCLTCFVECCFFISNILNFVLTRSIVLFWY